MICRSSLRRTVAHPFSRRTDSSTTGSGNAGFTLIELLVVIVILGILIAVAIPIFIRQTNLAREGAAESMLSGMGRIAYIGINDDGSAKGIRDEVLGGTGSGIAICYPDGCPATQPTVECLPSKPPPNTNPPDPIESKGRNCVVAQATNGQWLAAVTPRDGRCTLINVSDGNGIISARTVNAANGQCRADLGTSMPLIAGDFNTALFDPKTGEYNQGNAKWTGNTLNMGYGMLLNKSGSTSFANGSLSAKVALNQTGTWTGLAFRGSTDAQGKYNGYVYQIDRATATSPPTAVVWKWADGKETGQKVLTYPLVGDPFVGINVNDPNDLQIDVSGNTFTAKLNGSTLGTGSLDPAYKGTSYGVRNGTSKTSTVSDLKLTPAG